MYSGVNSQTHWKDTVLIQIFLEMILRGLVSQFPHSCFSARFIYSHDRTTYFPAAKQVNRSWEYINCSQKHECGNWERSRAVSFLGMHKQDLLCSAGQNRAKSSHDTIYFRRPFTWRLQRMVLSRSLSLATSRRMVCPASLFSITEPLK